MQANLTVVCAAAKAYNGRSVTYSYDGLARLSTAVTVGSATYPKWGLSWVYDRYGNRSDQNQTYGNPPANHVSVSAGTNRITTSGYAYESNGNATNDGYNTLIYDAENRAVSATNVGSSGTYTYDGNGLRVKRVSGSTTTVSIYSGSKVIAEYDNGAAPTSPNREYYYGGSALVAMYDPTANGGGGRFYHKDHLSNRVITDSYGNVAEQLGHYPFGESWYNASNEKLLFTTYARDAESGNDYAMARYHVNRLGRFSSLDPFSGSPSDPQTLNKYSYARLDPINFVDPTGLWCAYYADTGGEIESTDAYSSPAECASTGGTWNEDRETVIVTASAISVDTFDVEIFGGPTEGSPGRGGGAKNAVAQYMRANLHDRLLNDPHCLSFLSGRGGSPLQTLRAISISLGPVENGGSAQTEWTSNWPYSLVPSSPSITIDPGGDFFQQGLRTSNGYLTGTPRYQAAELLHELGHATGVLPNENFSPDFDAAEATNNYVIGKHCAKTLNSFQNVPFVGPIPQ